MAERIKEKRIELGLTQEELGEKLGLQKSAIAKYENGRVENIKRSVIADMAKIFNCSPTYLMGFDEPSSSTLEPKQNTVEKVKAICKKRKIPIARLERELGFSNGYIRGLREGKFPADRLKAISDYLNVSIEYLLGMEEESNANEYILEDVYFSLAKEAQECGLTEEDVETILETIKAVKRRRLKKEQENK